MVLWTVVALAVLGTAGGLAFIYSGIYNIAATAQHSRLVYWMLQTTKQRSVAHHAADLQVPDLSSAALAERGLALYQTHCVQCHGAPALPPEPFARGLEPVAPNLAHIARERSAAELYWAIRYGIKMTAMPAWEYRLADADLWAIVALVRRLPAYAPADYAEQVARLGPTRPVFAPHIAAREPTEGIDPPAVIALRQHACDSCHEIPGVTGPPARTGPALAGIGGRRYIAGVLPNTHANMIRWIMHPQAVKPLNAMPDMGVSEADAEEIAAYLATLR